MQPREPDKRAAARPAKREPTSSSGLRALRRSQILLAARAIVARDGLEALTFSSLEEQLGYSRGVITYHFADKEELVEELLFAAVAEIDADTSVRLSRSSTLDEKVRAVLASKARGFLEKEEASRVLLSFWGRAGRDARARRVHSELFARYRAEAATLAKAARKERSQEGHAKPDLKQDASLDINPDAFGALLVGVIIGLAVQAILQPDAFSLDAAVEEAARAFSARLRGA